MGRDGERELGDRQSEVRVGTERGRKWGKSENQ